MREFTRLANKVVQVVTACLLVCLLTSQSVIAESQDPEQASKPAQAALDQAKSLAESKRQDEAIAVCNKALALLDTSSERGRIDRARLLERVAIVYAMQEKFEKAEIAAVEAKTILEKLVAPSHFGLSVVRSTLAQILISQCKYSEASLLIDLTLSNLTKKDDVQTRDSSLIRRQKNLLIAEWYRLKYYVQINTDREALAVDSIRSAIKILDQESDPRLKGEKLECQNDLAAVLIELAKFKEAERISKEVMLSSEGTWTSDSMNKGITIGCLATIYYRQGRYSEALPLAYKVLDIAEKQNGKEHLAVAEVLDKIGDIFLKLNRHAEAVPYLERSSAIRKKFL